MLKSLTATVLLVSLAASAQTPGVWENDFALQPIASRPPLEVRYTDGTRTAFEIIAAAYNLTGELRTPHRLVDTGTGDEWLSLTVTAGDGTVYSSRNAAPESRINLYRRGPYYCEVHWFDLRVANEEGKAAPLKGDLALYCYPNRILANVVWHATKDFAPRSVGIRGIVERDFTPEPFEKGSKQAFASPLFGETEPLPPSALKTVEAVAALRYDSVRGCYVVGSHNPGGFQQHFYEYPNHYERVCFSVTNPGPARTIYVCHQSCQGGKGTVEGGVILDEQGHPLPVTVQISKNFAGEKEEKFYNPTDTPFSETYFPLVLAENETQTVSSLHLYQNWGAHMVKQFSSLGAWMDYFHSSTGVTETTCYVPFKFAGLPGVAIADFRAMSQYAFWPGQPQHDNVAGHSFLSYHDGAAWQYLAYRGTTYRSTGPNWMDVRFDYLSTDGAIRATVDSFEVPQDDELRQFLHIRYDVQKPVTIANAPEQFRLLTSASWVQKLRYTHFAASGTEDIPLSFDDDHFGVRAHPLVKANAFAAIYGDRKGGNAYVLRRWSAKVSGQSVEPAASVLCEKTGDTRLLLVPQSETLELKPGDFLDVEVMIVPFGSFTSADSLRRETLVYGEHAPRITAVARGTEQRSFPPTVRADGNQAEFTIQGGRDRLPVVVTGLDDYRWPRIYRRDHVGWTPIQHARVTDLDGIQTFCDAEDHFGAVFLVSTDNTPPNAARRRRRGTG